MTVMNKRTLAKIDRVNAERKNILEEIREKISEGNSVVIDNIDNIMLLFEQRDRECKEYVAILKVKTMLQSLLEEIVKAETVEDVQKLRNRINYQINKVKKILIERNVKKEVIDSYLQNINNSRKSFKEYLRVLKREQNMKNINVLLCDEVSKEDKKEIIKLANNEDNFNKRYKKRTTESEVVTMSNEENIRPSLGYSYEILPEEPMPKVEEQIENNFQNTKVSVTKDIRLEEWKKRYGIYNPRSFTDNFLVNIKTFFLNVPTYIHNRSRINKLICDYNKYYSGNDLRKVIGIIVDENDILKSFSKIFKTSKMAKRETEISSKKCTFTMILNSLGTNDINVTNVDTSSIGSLSLSVANKRN